MVLSNFGLFYDLYYSYDLFFPTIFVRFKCIYFQVIFLVIDSFKVLVLFPLHVCNKNQEYASYVNTDKIKGNNPYQYSNSKIKLKEGSVSQVIKFAKEKFKIKTEFC